MNKITIEFDEKGMSYRFEEACGLEEAFWVLLNTCAALTEQTAEIGRKEKDFDETEFRAAVYDKLNKGFTNILGHVAPEHESHPNLTATAILLAENQLMKEAYNAGMSVEEYLPIAEKKNEKELKIWRMNEQAGIKHKQKQDRQRKEAKPNNAFKVIKGGK